METAEFPFPDEWADRVGHYLDGRLPVEPARLASTVVLLRDCADGPEAYVIKRAASMAFAGGRYAFPGGRVDPSDAEPIDAWAGPGGPEWARCFGCEQAAALAFVSAAVRETFEETGVLLAGRDSTSVLDDTGGAEREADRRAVERRALTLPQLLARDGLVLRADLLGAWARWVTPEFEPRRYDTAFFVAELPAGQHAREVSGETESVAWTTPAQAIADFEAGRVAMLPPTISVLRELLPYTSAAAAVAAAADREVKPIMVRIGRAADGGYRLVWSS